MRTSPASVRWRSAPWAARALAPAILVIGLLSASVPADTGDLKIGNVAVFLNDDDVTVQVALVGALPASLHESLQSGIPVHLQILVELKQQGFLRDGLVRERTVERQVSYNVLTREYKVVSTAGEQRDPYITRHLREAQRVASDLRVVRLFPGFQLDPRALYYVRVRAAASAGGLNTWVARLAGDAEETGWVRSPLLTPLRRQ
jgi:hypothetical protein